MSAVESGWAGHALDVITDVAVWAGHHPWWPALAFVATTVAAVLASRLIADARHQRLVRHARMVHIIAPPQVDPAGVTAWWANLAALLAPTGWQRRLYGGPHVAFEYRWDGRQLTVQVWLPGTVAAGPVAAAARAAWPGAATTITDANSPIPADALTVGGILAPARAAWYPFETHHDADPLRALIAAGAELRRTEAACLQVLARPAGPRLVAALRRAARGLRTGRAVSSGPSTRLLDLVTDILTLGHGPGPGAGPRVADPVRDRDARAALDKAMLAQWEIGRAHV